MGAKATFDILTRTITLTEAPVIEGADSVVDIDVRVDLYSDGKEDWQASAVLRKLAFPIQAVGGQAKPGGQLGTTYFLQSDWKIIPYDASHRLRIDGNLYKVDGSGLVAPQPGRSIIVELNVSSLVETVSTGGGGGGTVDNAAIAAAVWSTDLSSYTVLGTAGYVVRRIMRAVQALLGLS